MWFINKAERASYNLDRYIAVYAEENEIRGELENGTIVRFAKFKSNFIAKEYMNKIEETGFTGDNYIKIAADDENIIISSDTSMDNLIDKVTEEIRTGKRSLTGSGKRSLSGT